MGFSFTITNRHGKRARAGYIDTPHGRINTPAFISVGTKATVKALTTEQVQSLGAEAVLGNTYHLYLAPGDELIRDAGGIGHFMNWKGPTFTDSGGFQVFSLGAAWNGTGQASSSKIAERGKVSLVASQPYNDGVADDETGSSTNTHKPFAKIDDDGVSFKSIIDGSMHRFTPERSMEIQHNIGADIMFAFDECTSPLSPYEYQVIAMNRTHEWAQRSLDAHRKVHKPGGGKIAPDRDSRVGIVADARPYQALFGVVQGGRHKDLRQESARIIGGMDFDGFGIGGSFDKEDMYSTVGWVNDILPEGKPRHLLGIGEPEDFFGGIENGGDTFDCVTPTRLGRNGTLYTSKGKIHMKNSEYIRDFGRIDEDCGCVVCSSYTPAYLSHLYRSHEMLAGTLGSMHNLYFLINLVTRIRESVIDGTYEDFKVGFLNKYKSRDAGVSM